MKVLQKNNFIKQILRPEENILGFGFQILLILCAICGKWLSISPLQVKRFSLTFWLLNIYSYITTCLNIYFIILFIVAWCILHNNVIISFTIQIYFICALLSQAVCASRSIIILLKKSKIEEFIKLIKVFKTKQNLACNRYLAIKRLDQFIVILLFIFLTSYICLIITNYKAVDELLNNIKSDTNMSTNSTLDERTLYHYMKSLYEVPFIKKYYSNSYLALYIFCMLNLGMVVVSDVLFLSCYWIYVEELKVLTKSLSKYLGDEVKLQWWIKRHKKLSRLLRDLNSITSPAITITVILSTCQICFTAFTVVKLYHQLMKMSLIVSMILVGFNSLLQLLLYCILGHKIREQVSELQNASYQAPWQETSLETQLATIMICSASNERSIQLPGSPYFALNLDFFISVIGAILTYFIILIQVQ